MMSGDLYLYFAMNLLICQEKCNFSYQRLCREYGQDLRPVGNNEMPDFNGEMPEGFGGKIPPDGFDGQIPEGFDGQMPPDGFNNDMPDEFDPSQMQDGKKPSSDSAGVNEDVNPENRISTH